MIKLILLTALLFCMGTARGQYDTAFCGQLEAISSGPFETPFPTGSRKTARTQYTISYGEIPISFNATTIDGVVLELMDDDPVGTTVDIRVKLTNTLQACPYTLDLVGLQDFCDTSGIQLQAGFLTLWSNISPGYWAGPGFNLIVEIEMQRSGLPGNSPRVPLDTSFLCAPTYYAQDTGLVSGLTTSNALYHGPLGKRPVIGFLYINPFLGESGNMNSPQVAVYPNPASDRITLRLLNGPDRVTVRLTDALGAEVRNASITTASNGSFEVPLTGLASGGYLLLVTDETARPLWQQRVVVR